MRRNVQQVVNLEPGRKRLERLEELASSFEGGPPETVIKWAYDEFGERLTFATGFGAEGMALLDMIVKINPQPQVFFLDTDFLFPETYELRQRIEARYGITIQAYHTSLTPEMQDERYGPHLWEQSPDLCCELRKLEPLQAALKGKLAWTTAIRREQTAAGRTARCVEWDSRWNLVKVNPLAYQTKKDVWRYIIQNAVLYNPLHDAGYPSIGCTHCTRAVRSGEDERAGRWSNHVKTECGLHIATQR